MSIYSTFINSHKIASILMLYPYQDSDYNHDNSGLTESGKTLILNHCKQLAEAGNHSFDCLTQIDLDTIDAEERIAQDDFGKKLLELLKNNFKNVVLRSFQLLSVPELNNTSEPMTVRVRIQYDGNEGFKRVVSSRYVVAMINSDDTISILD